MIRCLYKKYLHGGYIVIKFLFKIYIGVYAFMRILREVQFSNKIFYMILLSEK